MRAMAPTAPIEPPMAAFAPLDRPPLELVDVGDGDC